MLRQKNNSRSISPRAKRWVVKSTRNGIQKVIEGAIVFDPLDRDGSDLFGREKREFHALHPGRDWLGDVHGVATTDREFVKRLVAGRRPNLLLESILLRTKRRSR